MLHFLFKCQYAARQAPANRPLEGYRRLSVDASLFVQPLMVPRVDFRPETTRSVSKPHETAPARQAWVRRINIQSTAGAWEHTCICNASIRFSAQITAAR